MPPYPPYMNYREFQFHKVRLKAYMESASNISRLFQFHKVRLKVYKVQAD